MKLLVLRSKLKKKQKKQKKTGDSDLMTEQ